MGFQGVLIEAGASLKDANAYDIHVIIDIKMKYHRLLLCKIAIEVVQYLFCVIETGEIPSSTFVMSA